MTPKTDNYFKDEAQMSLTYALDADKKCIRGMADGLEAIKQAAQLILSTERYAHIIHSWGYGVELTDLIGQPKEYAAAKVKRTVVEALLQDDRITAVDNFTFYPKANALLVTFIIHTKFGDIEMEVNI